MDGGIGQKHMSETIKRSIKQNAVLRRERRLPAPYDNQPEIGDIVSDIVIVSAESAVPLTTPGPFTRSDKSHFQSPSTTSTLPTVSSSASSWSAGLGIPLQAPAQVQLASIMIYLDYVFPFLFPHYRPSLLETGRQWLLGSLTQNEVSFHTAASLSAYFFSLAPQGEGEGQGQEMHEDCKALVWDRLVGQMDLAVQKIQHDVSFLSQGPRANSLTDKTRIMEEIAQLLIVEVTVRRNVDWAIHLTPALALFDDVFRGHGLDQSSEPSLAVLLSALPRLELPAATPHHKPLPNTSEQSALVFFASLLLFVDIVASTSLGKAPTLQSYHHTLLSAARGGEKCQIRLETVVGCQNWPLVAIGNISALCAWKRNAKQSGTFSVLNLVSLAGPISQALDDGLERLDTNPPRPGPNNGTDASRRLLEGYYSRHDRALEYTSIVTVTRVWAYAAELYLSVLLSGWQPRSAEVQGSVARVVSLLNTVQSPAQLRSLSWPICVAGCLALPDQEQDFRRIVGEVGELGEFGTAGTALRIMEAVWASRDTVDGHVWDFASFLTILGSPALLI